jgi:hypothetical protein
MQEKLVDVIDHLLPPLEGYMQLEASAKHGSAFFIPEKAVDNEALIIGALESSFWDMVIAKYSENCVPKNVHCECVCPPPPPSLL